MYMYLNSVTFLAYIFVYYVFYFKMLSFLLIKKKEGVSGSTNQIDFLTIPSKEKNKERETIKRFK